jgi:hypothetical protein
MLLGSWCVHPSTGICAPEDGVDCYGPSVCITNFEVFNLFGFMEVHMTSIFECLWDSLHGTIFPWDETAAALLQQEYTEFPCHHTRQLLWRRGGL